MSRSDQFVVLIKAGKKSFEHMEYNSETNTYWSLNLNFSF